MRARISIGILVALLALTIFAYWPGLYGAYIFDDGPNITQNAQVAIADLKPESLKRAAFSSTSGPLGRPIAMVSFALNHYLTGFDPFYFKLTNLIIHLANGIGIFVLTSMLLGVYRRKFEPSLSSAYTGWIACAVTAAWLLHPFNLTSVLYVVQRMASLSALFTIWGLVLYCWGRTRLLEGRNGILPILASLILFVPLAAFSKENGALLPVLMLVVEISLFQFETQQRSARIFIAAIFLISVALPVLASIAYMVMHPNFLLSGYAGRDFNLSERVMTEARVLWLYMRLALLPSTAQMGLFHDDLDISRGLLQPVTTLLSIAGIVLLFICSIVLKKRAPLITFGILFFFAGHILESTIFPFELVHEHRNYLPIFGLLFAMFFYLLYPLRHASSLRLRQITVGLLIGLFAIGTYHRAGNWSNPFALAQSEVENHPKSPRNNSEMGNIYANLVSSDPLVMESNYLTARHYFEQATSLNPNYPNGLFGLIHLTASRGKPIENSLIEELARRLEHSPATANTGDLLIKLLICRNTETCSLSEHDLEQLIQASLRNTTLRGSARALVLSSYTDFLVNTAKDYSKAVSIQKQAADSAPQEFEHRLTLIKLLIALQRHEEATAQLAKLRQLDKLQAYAAEIQLRSQMIDDARKQPIKIAAPAQTGKRND